MDWDVFISHAWEDKVSFARPLAEALQAKGLKVWFDEFSLTVGDSLRRSIDQGLAKSRYGIVILSPNFFAKEWPQKELDGLVSREISGAKVILPIWHKVTADQIRKYSPILADRVAVTSSRGLEYVVAELLRAMGHTSEILIPKPTVTPSLLRRLKWWQIVSFMIAILSCIAAWLALPQVQNLLDGVNTPEVIPTPTSTFVSIRTPPITTLPAESSLTKPLTVTHTPTETSIPSPTFARTPTETPTDIPTNTPTPKSPTPTPTVTTITLQNVHLVYDYLDRRGYMLGGEEATITVNKLPVIIAGSAKTEIPFGDIASITMQPAKRQHPEVDHWDIEFLDATITLRNQKTIRSEIGTYLPLPKSGSKPAFEIYNGEAINIRNTYLSGEIVDTGLVTRLSLYDIQAISIDAPGNPPESLGTVIITPGENEIMK